MLVSSALPDAAEFDEALSAPVPERGAVVTFPGPEFVAPPVLLVPLAPPVWAKAGAANKIAVAANRVSFFI